MACDINVIINGKTVFVAHNDKELDDWISDPSHREALSDGLTLGFNKIYSLDSREETLRKLKKVGAEFEAFDKNRSLKENVSAGATVIWTLVGGLSDPTQPLIRFFEDKNVSKNNDEQSKYFVDPKDVGTEVDTTINRYFERKKDDPKSYMTSDMQLHVRNAIEKIIIPELQSKYRIKISDFQNQIFPQVHMQTKSMNEDFKQALKNSKKEFEPSKGIKKAIKDISVIEGIADLLIIDDNGVAHIIDFKTWNDNNFQLDSTVGNKYAAQVATYQEILRFYGIPIGQSFIIGFKTEYQDNDTGQHVRLSDIKFDKIIRVPENNRYANAVRNYLWKELSVNDNTMSELGSVLQELFPSTNIANRLNAREIDYAFAKDKKILPVEKDKNPDEWNKGYRFYFTRARSITGLPKTDRIYGKTMAELTEDSVNPDGSIKKAPFKAYMDLWNKKKADRFKNIAKDLMYAMSIHSLDDFEETVKVVAPRNVDTVMHHFKRYIKCNWKFKENETLNSNGIYLFEKGDKLEIVVLDEENMINGKVKLLHGNSILGTYIKDSSITDNRVVMSNDYGNLMLMKACALLALDPELTKNKKVTNIKAMNLHNARVYEENPNRLITSWNMLAQQYNETHPDKHLRNLGYNTFEEDAKALMDIADEYIELLWQSDSNTYRNLIQERASQLELTRESIKNRIDKLQAASGNLWDLRDKNYKNDDRWVAYAYLRKAMLVLDGFNIFQENDIGAVLQGINPTGIKMRSFNSSNSPIARQMGELMSRFRTAVRLQFIKEQFTWSKLIDAAYKEQGWNATLGNDWTFFDSWFEKDENGKIKPEFRLLRPDQFKNKKEHGPATIKAYEYFLEINGKYRWMDEATREEMRGTEEWYEVPMIKAGFLEHFTSGKPLAAIKSIWEKYKDAGIGMIMGNPEIEKTREQLEEIDVDELPNVIVKDYATRQAFVEKQGGVEGLERHLDFVFLSMLYSGVRAERSPMFCEMFTAFLVVTDYMMDTNGLDIKSIRNAMTQFVQNKFFGRDIRPVEEKNLNAFLGMLKGLTAQVALGWNSRAFFREILTGDKKHLNRWIAKADKTNRFVQGTKKFFERPDFIDYSDFLEAYLDVMAHAQDNTSIFSFYHQLNSIYGMVNFSNEEMAEASKRHQWTVLGISDKSSVTATAPDFLHRMAILGGHLKTIGAFDAYSLDETTGRIQYDMKKDQRFQTWLKYKDNEDNIPDLETRRKYNQEKQLYQEELDSWNTIGYNLKYGSLLPQALSPRSTLNVKEYADEQYGNYDNETQSLIQKQTLGSLFFQYKTYGLAQFQLWFAEPGFTNTLRFNYVLNQNGEKIVLIPVATPEEYAQHGDFIEKPESEVTEEEWKRNINGITTRYKKQLGGNLFIGKAQSSWLLGAKLMTLNGDEFLELWNSSPEFRSNLYISLLDLFELGLIGLLLRLFWDTDETPIYRQGFLQRWTYGVIQGMSTDGPLFQTLSGILGDGTPPVLGMLKNYYRTFNSVINGNESFLYGLTNTLGMTRELSNLFRGNN